VPRPSKPFTVPHFRTWARGLLLDTEEPWELEDFQAAWLRDVFRGFLESWLIIPEGNAKTTLAGGLVLYHARYRKGARVPVAASSRDQAEWLYQAAAGFVERSPSIEHLFKCQEGYRRIKCESMSSRIQIFAADDRTGDGVIPTLALLEELHRHRTLRLYRTWRGKIEKRGGQLAAISTAGEPDGEFEAVRAKMRDEATDIRRRGAHLRAATADYVLHEYAVLEGMDPENMRDVKKANPLKAIDVPMLKRKHDSPAMSPGHWLRFACGIPAGSDEQPIKPAEWDALAVDIGRVEEGESVYLAPSVGHNAAVALAAVRPEGRVAIHVEHLEASDDDSILRRTEDLIADLCERYDVLEARLPLSGFRRSTELLEVRGVPVVEDPHSPTRLAEFTGSFERLLRAGLLMHDGDRTTRGQVLAATKKTTETGERYIESVQGRALVAIMGAVHAATAPRDDLVMILPGEMG